jgi:hypothetical protein
MGGLDLMRKRMYFDGGETADGRNVRGKYLSFKSALENSYQGEWIIFNDRRYRCLINPSKLTEEYDQKEISIDFEVGLQNGDVFYWERTNSYWIVYLQKIEEEAYFRAQIRRCNYQINDWWVYLRGPVETAIVWSQKHQIEINEMNFSILLYVAKTEETIEFFSRFQIVKFDGHNWRVAATDKYSQNGLIEVYLEEYFDNTMEDNMVIPEIIEPDKTKPYISGPTVVKPYDINVTYQIMNYSLRGGFVVNSNKVKIISQTEDTLILEITTGKAGTFILEYYTNGKKITDLTVAIDSLM